MLSTLHRSATDAGAVLSGLSRKFVGALSGLAWGPVGWVN